MKLNNKGFAISGVLYPVFVLFLVLIFGIVGILSSSKTLTDRVRNEIELELNGEDLTPTITMTGSDITIANGYTFDLMEGVKAFDYEGKELGPERITYVSTPTFSNTVNGVYEIVYTATDIKGRTKNFTRTLRVETGAVSTLTFVPDGTLGGLGQDFPGVAKGTYKVELWGAQGGSTYYNTDGSGALIPGGYGAYTSGVITAPETGRLRLYVGGKGGNGSVGVAGLPGYNGGTLGGNGYQGGGGGGGATDLRIIPNNSYRYVKDYIAGSSMNGSNHWVEIQVMSGGVNVALNKPVTGSVPSTAGGPYTRVTDNITTSATYAESSVGGQQSVEIDLGAEYPIDSVRVYHYYQDSRVYNQGKVVLSNADRSVNTTIYDSSWSGTYAEPAIGFGHFLDFNGYFDNLKSRIMVAAGGAGTSNYVNAITGGFGGALTGSPGFLNVGSAAHTLAGGGTQTAGGTAGLSASAGKFGYGGNANSGHGGGGGGGYYGGGGGGIISSGVSSGAGGSSFVSGLSGYNAITSTSAPGAIVHTGLPNHFSGLVFTDTSAIAGNASMPAPSGGTQIGNTGNGYARITFLKKINID